MLTESLRGPGIIGIDLVLVLSAHQGWCQVNFHSLNLKVKLKPQFVTTAASFLWSAGFSPVKYVNLLIRCESGPI